MLMMTGCLCGKFGLSHLHDLSLKLSPAQGHGWCARVLMQIQMSQLAVTVAVELATLRAVADGQVPHR